MIIHGDVIPVAEEEIERYEALVKRMVANLAVQPGRFVVDRHWMLHAIRLMASERWNRTSGDFTFPSFCGLL